ncbi:MAG: uracil phosphoribosyltransferase [Chloroflexota bacterium]
MHDSNRESPRVTTVSHPLVEHALAHLRDRATDGATFQRHARIATQVLALDVLRDLPLQQRRIDTPLESTMGNVLAIAPIFVPVLRSGLAMLDAITDFLPGSRVGFVGMERDETTAIARRYYDKLPSHLESSRTVILDPMLATGGSVLAALGLLRERGARDLRVACIVAAPEGVLAVNHAFPDVVLFTCALDSHLNARKFIVPGLGDFGDRYFGTAD